MSYVYPPHFEDIKAWTRTQKFVTFTILQTRWNLTYGRSVLVLEALQRDLVIMPHSDNQGRYEVYVNSKENNKMNAEQLRTKAKEQFLKALPGLLRPKDVDSLVDLLIAAAVAEIVENHRVDVPNTGYFGLIEKRTPGK